MRLINMLKKGLLLGTLVAFSQLVSAAALQKLDFAALPGDETEIKLEFDGAAPQINGYTIEKPARISIDLIGASSNLESKYHNLGSGNARSITVVEANDRTRLIINLNELTGYSSHEEGNTLYLILGDKQNNEETVQQSVQASSSQVVSGIDFRRGQEGDGQVVIDLSTASIPIDVREEAGRIYVEFVETELPEKLRRRLDVTDFATPVVSVDALYEGGNTVLVIQPTGNYEYLAYQADEKFTINVKPVSADEIERRKRDAFVFTGEKLSLNFQDIEVRSVLQLIADFTNMNLVASDSVDGKITLRLQNVPHDQALELILKTKALDKRIVGNVMLVAPAAEIAAREKLELESSKQVEALAPTRTEYMTVNYAKAEDLATLITGDSSILSSRGSVSVDDRTNTLIINDTVAKLEELRSLVNELDIPVQQVLIEARIVLASTSFSHELGVRWGGLRYDVGELNEKGSTPIFTGRSTHLRNVNSQVLVYDPTNPNFGTLASTVVEDAPNDLVVDFGVENANATRFAVGFSDINSGLLEFEISALEEDGHAEVVASPRVLTADQQKAKIESGTQIPYLEATSSGAASIAFQEAVLSLEVTPHITPDGRIIMELNVTNDSVGEITATNVPSINTNRVETSVLVEDGDTVVLGGIFQESINQQLLKTPFFGDLPVIGRLFRREVDRDEKSELLIFVTPKLLKDTVANR